MSPSKNLSKELIGSEKCISIAVFDSISKYHVGSISTHLYLIW